MSDSECLCSSPGSSYVGPTALASPPTSTSALLSPASPPSLSLEDVRQAFLTHAEVPAAVTLHGARKSAVLQLADDFSHTIKVVRFAGGSFSLALELPGRATQRGIDDLKKLFEAYMPVGEEGSDSPLKFGERGMDVFASVPLLTALSKTIVPTLGYTPDLAWEDQEGKVVGALEVHKTGSDEDERDRRTIFSTCEHIRFSIHLRLNSLLSTTPSLTLRLYRYAADPHATTGMPSGRNIRLCGEYLITRGLGKDFEICPAFVRALGGVPPDAPSPPPTVLTATSCVTLLDRLISAEKRTAEDRKVADAAVQALKEDKERPQVALGKARQAQREKKNRERDERAKRRAARV
ncbi:hypothetical protein JCM11251_004761 [Rhodosporidiobolus azoricus]